MTPDLALTVNGEARTMPVGSTVADLVAALGCKPTQVAVERNREIVRRADHAAAPTPRREREYADALAYIRDLAAARTAPSADLRLLLL